MVTFPLTESYVISILQHIRRRLAQPISTSYIPQRRPRIRMPGEILQVHDVTPPLPGRRERRHPE